MRKPKHEKSKFKKGKPKEEETKEVVELMAMGFLEDKVRQALKAAYNNR